MSRYHLELEWGGTPVGFLQVSRYHLELEWSFTSCNVCHVIFRSDLHLIFLESGILSALTVRVGRKKSNSVVCVKSQGSRELEPEPGCPAL